MAGTKKPQAKKASAKKKTDESTEITSAASALISGLEGNDKALALEQVQALIASGGLQALLDAAGLKVVAKGAAKKDSRLARVREWATGLKTRLEGEDLTTVQALAEAIGKAQFPENPGDLTQEQVDDMMAEALTIRPSQDILKGRYDAIRIAVFAAMTEKEEGDEFAPSTLFSIKHGHKFVKQIREVKASANLDALEALVGPEVWKAITRTTRTVDEQKLAKAVATGVVTYEQVQQVTSPASQSASFYVRPIKDGEEV